MIHAVSTCGREHYSAIGHLYSSWGQRNKIRKDYNGEKSLSNQYLKAYTSYLDANFYTCAGSILYVLPLGDRGSFVLFYHLYCSQGLLCTNYLLLGPQALICMVVQAQPYQTRLCVTLSRLVNILSNTTSCRPLSSLSINFKNGTFEPRP